MKVEQAKQKAEGKTPYQRTLTTKYHRKVGKGRPYPTAMR